MTDSGSDPLRLGARLDGLGRRAPTRDCVSQLVAASRSCGEQKARPGSMPAASTVAGFVGFQTSMFGWHRGGKHQALGVMAVPGAETGHGSARRRDPRESGAACAALRQRQQRRPVLFLPSDGGTGLRIT